MRPAAGSPLHPSKGTVKLTDDSVFRHRSRDRILIGLVANFRDCYKLPGDPWCSCFNNHLKSEAASEKFILCANGPFTGKAEALLQPKHGFEARNRALRTSQCSPVT